MEVITLQSTSRPLLRASRAVDVENAAFEVDFLPVGDGKKGGDAIAVRFGDLAGGREGQFVLVIDGGTLASGQALVEHIRKYYGTDEVDLVVSTHPDADHACGLKVVLENLDVKRLWMHRPWDHSPHIRTLFQNARITNASLDKFIRASLVSAHELESIAQQQGVTIEEPFSDRSLPFQDFGVFVLGPTEAFYRGLLPSFRSTPQPKESTDTLLRNLLELAKEGVRKLFESWGFETLTDPEANATSAENNSSVVLVLRIAGRSLLFTGDAGVPALELAADQAERLGISLPSLNFVQIPHHGSKRNVGPSILNRIVGQPLPEGVASKMTAFVSVPKDGAPKHPARKVTNAFLRRGVSVVATVGSAKRHGHKAPDRPGWVPATPLSFYSEVDE